MKQGYEEKYVESSVGERHRLHLQVVENWVWRYWRRVWVGSQVERCKWEVDVRWGVLNA